MRSLPAGRPSPVDLAALLRGGRLDGAGLAARERNAHRAEGRKPPLASSPEAEFLVLGHNSRLAQIVTNLIDNGCSFSDPGGAVRVSLAENADGIRRRRRAVESAIVIRSTTTAPAFRRMRSSGYSSASTRIGPSQGFGQNSGLGLSISRQIVEAHGDGSARRTGLVDAEAGRLGADADEDRAAWSGRSFRRRTAGLRPMTPIAAPQGSEPTRRAVVFGENGVMIRGASDRARARWPWR